MAYKKISIIIKAISWISKRIWILKRILKTQKPFGLKAAYVFLTYTIISVYVLKIMKYA